MLCKLGGKKKEQKKLKVFQAFLKEGIKMDLCSPVIQHPQTFILLFCSTPWFQGRLYRLACPVPWEPTKHCNSPSYLSCRLFSYMVQLGFQLLEQPQVLLLWTRNTVAKQCLDSHGICRSADAPVENLCHYVFGPFCWQVIYCLCSSSLFCYQKKHCGLFFQIQTSVRIEILCSQSLHMHLYVQCSGNLASPEFAWKEKAISWE